MKTREDLELQLFTNRLMSTYEEIELFEEALEILYSEEKIENISLFLKVLDDRSENKDVMFGIIHGIEAYISFLGFNKYLKIILDSMNLFNVNSEEWQEILFLRMINSDEYFDDLLNIISNQNDELIKNKLQLIFSRIILRNEDKFGQKCRLLLNELGKKN